jgi:hypothetical protein
MSLAYFLKWFFHLIVLCMGEIEPIKTQNLFEQTSLEKKMLGVDLEFLKYMVHKIFKFGDICKHVFI